jgi:hypothetical protein
MVRRSAGIRAPRFGKAQGLKIELGDERIEEADRVFRLHVILKGFGKEQNLGAIQTRAMIHT